MYSQRAQFFAFTHMITFYIFQPNTSGEGLSKRYVPSTGTIIIITINILCFHPFTGNNLWHKSTVLKSSVTEAPQYQKITFTFHNYKLLHKVRCHAAQTTDPKVSNHWWKQLCTTYWTSTSKHYNLKVIYHFKF